MEQNEKSRRGRKSLTNNAPAPKQADKSPEPKKTDPPAPTENLTQLERTGKSLLPNYCQTMVSAEVENSPPTSSISRKRTRETTGSKASLSIKKPIETDSASSKSKNDPVFKVAKGRGRPSKVIKSNKATKKHNAKKPKIVITDDEEEKSSEEVDSGDDDEFNPDKESESVSESVSLSSDSEDDLLAKKISKQSFIPFNDTAKKYNTRRSLNAKQQDFDTTIDSEEPKQSSPSVSTIDEQSVIQLKYFDPDQKITQWDYELEPDSKTFIRPKIPCLSDAAIQPYMSSKSKPPKIIVYACPFCDKIFTYTLVFKNHLYSCSDNKNVPKYQLFCVNRPACGFIGSKKQEMINHYTKEHSAKSSPKKPSRNFVVDEDYVEDDLDSSSTTTINTSFRLTKTKQNQLEASQYYFINMAEFKFAVRYLNKFVLNACKRLSQIDSFCHNEKQFVNFHELDVNKLAGQSRELTFKLPDFAIELKPFEYHTSENFNILNVSQQITAIDWSRSPNPDFPQYLAFATVPFKNLNQAVFKMNENTNNKNECLLSMYESSNLINLVKVKNLNRNAKTEPDFEIFSLLHQTIGYVYNLKWRPGYDSSTKSSDFIGYLLATSSDGNGYIFSVFDMLNRLPRNSSKLNKKIEKLSIYESKKQIILKQAIASGQCTSSDWSQLNGATQIALGYVNGTIAIFNVNSSYLKNQCEKSVEKMLIYPQRTFNSHSTCVKCLRWCKLNAFILASGSVFSREVKVWDLTHDNEKENKRSVLDYEVYVNDFEFSLHSNDLLIAKEANLKGENHLIALDLTHSVFNLERDESRAHNSLFYTNASMTSLNHSDYLNKMVVCDVEGNVLLSRSNDTKYWFQKHKLMNNSYARVAKFTVTSREVDPNTNTNSSRDQNRGKTTSDSNKIYNLDLLEDKMSKAIIEVDLDPVQNNKHCAKVTTNPISIDINSLNNIKWNPNIQFNSWYAGSSYSGFLFFHRLNELNSDLADVN